VNVPKSEWIFTYGAFEPIIDVATFAEAQRILEARTFNKTNEEILDGLRALLASEHRLTLNLIKNSPIVPSPSAFRDRFGSLRRAYDLIGYGHSDQFGSIDMRRRTRALRDELMAKIVATFPTDVSIVRRGGRWRSRLRLSHGLIVSVIIARSVHTWKDALRWRIDPVAHERKFVTLLARLDTSNSSILDLHLLPNMDRRKIFHISLKDPWLNRGKSLTDLSRLRQVVADVRSVPMSKRQKSVGTVRAPRF